MVNALRTFLGTCVDNITVVNYSVKVTLSVSMELNGILELLDSREERMHDSNLDYEIMLRNMLTMTRFIEVLQRPHRLMKTERIAK